VEDLRKLLGLSLADTSPAIHQIGHLSARPDHGHQIDLPQTALFHKVPHHFVGRYAGSRVALFIVRFDQLRQQFGESFFFRRGVLLPVQFLERFDNRSNCLLFLITVGTTLAQSLPYFRGSRTITPI